MTRQRKAAIALLAVVLLLVGARVAMSHLVEDYVNDKLAALDSYDGRVVMRNAFIDAFARSLEGSIKPDKNKKEAEVDRDAPQRLKGPAGKT